MWAGTRLMSAGSGMHVLAMRTVAPVHPRARACTHPPACAAGARARARPPQNATAEFVTARSFPCRPRQLKRRPPARAATVSLAALTSRMLIHASPSLCVLSVCAISLISLSILNIPRRAGRPRQRRNKKTVARVRAQGSARAQTLNHAPWRARNGQHARLMALWATYPPLPSLRARARTRPAAPVAPSSA